MSRINKIFSWKEKKSFDINNDMSAIFSSEYNTRYVKELTRSDYLALYTGWAYVAVSTIADTVASLDRELTKTKDTSQSIEHPYEYLVTYELIQGIVSYLQLNGSAYLWKVMTGNKITELQILRPDLVIFDEAVDGELLGYKYQLWNRQVYFQKDEIIAFHNFNPLQAYPKTAKGISPMQAVALQMNMDITATRWNNTFFKNGGSIKDTLTSDNVISAENKKRYIREWRNEYQGVENAHKVAILDNWLKYNNVSPSQKEMDFVESRRFTRDEVFAIFKLPQSILGITENSNRAVAIQAEISFYRNCIMPIATMIQETLNKTVFNGVWYFYFDNVMPVDVEQLDKDFNNGAITINEYRQSRGFAKIKEGDVLKIDMEKVSDISYEKVEKTASHGTKSSKSIVESVVNDKIYSKIKWTPQREEYWQKVREKKIKRTNEYEKSYIEASKIVFAEQERDALQAVKSVKGFKEAWNSVKYVSMWLSLLSPIQKDAIYAEAQEALSLVWIETAFKPWTAMLDRYIRTNITKMAKEVDKVTKEKIFDIIDAGNNSGASVQDISKEISKTFDDFGKKRALTIARTEITRASNWATEQARKDSGVVEQKEWYTATDERVCEHCWPMNWKVIDIGKSFFDKWHTLVGVNGWQLKLDYETIKTPPLHPNCRCTLLPVIK